jgi:hypothetical protein
MLNGLFMRGGLSVSPMRLDIKGHRRTAVADPLWRAGGVDDGTSWPPQT